MKETKQGTQNVTINNEGDYNETVNQLKNFLTGFLVNESPTQSVMINPSEVRLVEVKRVIEVLPQ